jgi:hypothetical protein
MGLALIIWPNLTYGEAYTAMKAHLDKHSPPFLVEFFDHDDRYSKQTLSRFLGDYNATEVSRLSSPFSHISPSTLQQYYAVTHVVFRVDQSGKSSLNLRPSD